MIQPTSIRCQNCGTAVEVPVRPIIDAQQDPQGKALLLNGQINQARCQNCGQVNTVLAPLLYHDGSKDLLIACVPMEVAMQRGQNEEQMVGDLMNQLTSQLDKDQFKAYMFNPKRALTLQGVIEQVMEADGITKEMMDAQRQRVDLLQELMDTADDEALAQRIRDEDAGLDMAFFQTMSLMAQRILQDGRTDIVQRMAQVQDALLKHSSVGQQIQRDQQQQQDAIEQVAQDVQALGEQATRADLRDLAMRYQGDDQRLQALVGMARQGFDYQFLQEFSTYISQAPAAERDDLEALRDRIVQLTQMVDQQMQQAMQQHTQFLQMLVNSPEPQAMLMENLELIDADFMSVLASNIQEAERHNDAQTVQRLRHIYNLAVNALQSQMSPELRFLNELMGAEDATERQQIVQAQAAQFDADAIRDMLDAVEEMLQAQGQAQALQHLATIRGELNQVYS